MNPFRHHLVIFALLLALLVPAAPAQDAAARGPRPELEPREVVEAMLAALRKNSDEGIAELYRFSSPRNREQTGPLESFRNMIRDYFPDMLGHRDAHLAPPLIDGDRAMLPVEILGSDELPHRYIFMLSRQQLPGCQGCWMADAVFGADQDGGPATGPEEAPQEYGA